MPDTITDCLTEIHKLLNYPFNMLPTHSLELADTLVMVNPWITGNPLFCQAGKKNSQLRDLSFNNILN